MLTKLLSLCRYVIKTADADQRKVFINVCHSPHVSCRQQCRAVRACVVLPLCRSLLVNAATAS
jgi:hypothetical protein